MKWMLGLTLGMVAGWLLYGTVSRYLLDAKNAQG